VTELLAAVSAPVHNNNSRIFNMRHSLGALTLSALVAQTGWAGESLRAGALDAQFSLTAGGANIDARHVNFGAGRVDQRSAENTGERAHWQEFYLKPGVNLAYPLTSELELLGAVSVLGATTLGDGDAGGYTRGSDGRVGLEEAYAGLHSGAWRFTAGRQNYQVGSGFIVMDGNLDKRDDGAFWLGPRSAFRDSGLLSYSQGPLGAQAFSLRTDDDLGDFRMTGMNLDYRLADTVTLGLMAFGVDSLTSAGQASVARDGMQVYNLRALNGRLPGLDNLTIDAELALERGHGDGVDYHARAWYAQAGYRFASLPLAPFLSYRYALFSGDSDLGDQHRKDWDPLSKGFSDWSTWLIGDVVGNYLLNNSNERVSQWTVKAQLSEHLTLGGIHYQFSLDQANYYGMPVSERRFADESVVFLDWIAAEGLSTSLSYNWVQPRSAVKEVFGDDNFNTLEMYFTYRY